ncbi:hypothetical protein [Methanosarcina vacuolata]
MLTKTADVRWIDEKTFIQRNEEGEVTHFQGIIEDITRNVKSA